MLNWTYQSGPQTWTARFLDLDWSVSHADMQQKADFFGGCLEPTLENTEWLIRQLQDPANWTKSEITYL